MKGDERIRTAVRRCSGSSPYESKAYVYWIQDEGGPIKVGYAANLGERLRSLQAGNPRPLTCLGYVLAPKGLERIVHRELAPHRLNGEWFDCHPDVLELLAVCLEEYGKPSCPECERIARYVLAGLGEPDAQAFRHSCEKSVRAA